jgi:hypothetical protein
VSLVVDSSMTLAWYFEDERTDASIAVLEQVAEAGDIVPAHWRLEVVNGLQVDHAGAVARLPRNSNSA